MWKDVRCELNVWQMSGLQHQVQCFATGWPGFHKFSRGPSLMTFFTGSLASGWTCNFRLDYVELPGVRLYNFNHNVKEKY